MYTAQGERIACTTVFNHPARHVGSRSPSSEGESCFRSSLIARFGLVVDLDEHILEWMALVMPRKGKMAEPCLIKGCRRRDVAMEGRVLQLREGEATETESCGDGQAGIGSYSLERARPLRLKAVETGRL